MRAPGPKGRTLSLLVVLAAGAAAAQSTAVITGQVTDAATGKPLVGVVVTATSPALQGGSSDVTDESGLYRLAQLPAGRYRVQAELESYRPFAREGLALRDEGTARLNLLLQPEALQSEVIEVAGIPPTVDVGSTALTTTVGAGFDTVALTQPNAYGVRTFEGLSAFAPQVMPDQYGYGYSGAQSPENLYLIDGVPVRDPMLGLNSAQLPVDFVQEANIITGGVQAEYGRTTGGVVRVVTKSGSNEFHGAAYGNWSPGLLSGTPRAIKDDGSLIVSQQQPWNTADFGLELGGPLIRDRLWFFAGFAPSVSRVRETRTLQRFVLDGPVGSATDYLYDEDGYIRRQELPGTRQARFNDSHALSYLAKLTFQAAPGHRLVLSVNGSPSEGTVPFAFEPLQHLSPTSVGGSRTSTDVRSTSLAYSGAFLERHLLLDVTLGWYHRGVEFGPNDGSGLDSAVGEASAAGLPVVVYQRGVPHSILDFERLPDEAAALCEPAGTRPTQTVVTPLGSSRWLAACPATGGGNQYWVGGFGPMASRTRDVVSARAALTALVQGWGHHVIKAGVDVEYSQGSSTDAFSGGVVLFEQGSRFQVSSRAGYQTGPLDGVSLGSRTATSSGLATSAYLQDSWSLLDVVTLNLGLRYEGQLLFAGDGSLGLTLPLMLSPRVGAIYDFTQQGRSKLFASYARYHESVPLFVAGTLATLPVLRRFVPGAPGGAGTSGPGCNPLQDLNQTWRECLDPANRIPQNRQFGGSYDPSPALLSNGGRAAVDPNLLPQSEDEVVAGAEYELFPRARLAATYTRRWMNTVIEDMSLDEGSAYFIGNPGYNLGAAFPLATRTYDAVTASFSKAMADGWFAQASYTWSSLRGNYNGLFRPETGQLYPNLNSDFDLLSAMPNRTGPLDADRTHAIKVLASKELELSSDVGLVLGLTYLGASGQPINALGAHPYYGGDEVFVFARGQGGRLPWTHQVNLRVALAFKFGPGEALTASVDVFNVFNFQAVTSVDSTFTGASVLPFTSSAPDPFRAACTVTPPAPGCTAGVTSLPYYPGAAGDNPGGTLLLTELNPNYGRPTSYQDPISVRLGLRYGF